MLSAKLFESSILASDVLSSLETQQASITSCQYFFETHFPHFKPARPFLYEYKQFADVGAAASLRLYSTTAPWEVVSSTAECILVGCYCTLESHRSLHPTYPLGLTEFITHSCSVHRTTSRNPLWRILDFEVFFYLHKLCHLTPSPTEFDKIHLRFVFPASGNLVKTRFGENQFSMFFWPCGHTNNQSDNYCLQDSSLREREQYETSFEENKNYKESIRKSQEKFLPETASGFVWFLRDLEGTFENLCSVSWTELCGIFCMILWVPGGYGWKRSEKIRGFPLGTLLPQNLPITPEPSSSVPYSLTWVNRMSVMMKE